MRDCLEKRRRNSLIRRINLEEEKSHQTCKLKKTRTAMRVKIASIQPRCNHRKVLISQWIVMKTLVIWLARSMWMRRSWTWMQIPRPLTVLRDLKSMISLTSQLNLNLLLASMSRKQEKPMEPRWRNLITCLSITPVN